jgi:PAS domain S-box-containing protein
MDETMKTGRESAGSHAAGRHGEALLAATMDHLAAGIFVCDTKWPDFPIVYISYGFTTLSQFSVEETLGRSPWFLLGPEAPPPVLEAIERAMAGGKPYQGTVWCRRRDGTTVWCEMTLNPMPGPDGSPRYSVGQLMDVTQRHQREELLKDAEAKHRGMFENAPEGIYQSTPDGRYLVVNVALARMYGYERPEQLLNQVSDIQSQVYVDPNQRQRFQREIERTGFVVGMEYQVHRRDGSIMWISESARAVRDDNGAVRYYEGFIDDITARKDAEAARARLEKQMIQAQKMEAIGTLAGGIAHDFNNILCSMLGFTELALTDKQITGQTRKNLESVMKSSNRARDLVKQILTFSRRSETERSPVKLGPLLKESLKLFGAMLPSTIEINLSLLTDDDVVVANSTEMHQVLMNLATNAAHAMRAKGGRLDYELQALELNESRGTDLSLKPGPYLCLTIRDTGHGMSQEVMDKIFEPFFTTKPTGEGTGLGLALIHKIISVCDGCITVDSQEGLGTTFRIYLPRSRQAAVVPAGTEADIRPGHREQILIVDDEVPILSMMQQRLRKMGYRVTTRADSLEALETFRREPTRFDLVLTDHTMPGLQGADLAEKIGEIRPETPVILMTGLNRPPGFEGSRFQSLRRLVRKPIDFVELSGRLREFLDRRSVEIKQAA